MNAGKDAAGQLGNYSYGAKGERSVGEVLKDIVSSLQDIIRSEIQLAKIETTEEGKKLLAASTVLGGAALLGVFALGFVFLAIMFALEYIVPAWAAAVILGFVLGIGAMASMAIGRQRLKAIRPPVKTMQTLKEDVQWMKEQPKS